MKACTRSWVIEPTGRHLSLFPTDIVAWVGSSCTFALMFPTDALAMKARTSHDSEAEA